MYGYAGGQERDFFIDNPLVRIHSMVEMVLLDRPCTMRFEFPFPGSFISTFLLHRGTSLIRKHPPP